LWEAVLVDGAAINECHIHLFFHNHHQRELYSRGIFILSSPLPTTYMLTVNDVLDTSFFYLLPASPSTAVFNNHHQREFYSRGIFSLLLSKALPFDDDVLTRHSCSYVINHRRCHSFSTTTTNASCTCVVSSSSTFLLYLFL
jgi:hypothetical protein